ncbi:MAG: hypothetical protein GXO48_09685 [Chlorobi bacterium]|nr:hypothetical protein [Chlorobiota bacterium]
MEKFYKLLNTITHPIFLPLYWFSIELVCRKWYLGTEIFSIYLEYYAIALTGLVFLPLLFIAIAHFLKLVNIIRPRRSERLILLFVMALVYATFLVSTYLHLQGGNSLINELLGNLIMLVSHAFVVVSTLILMETFNLRASIHVAGWTLFTYFLIINGIKFRWECILWMVPTAVVITGLVASLRLRKDHTPKELALGILAALVPFFVWLIVV